MLLLESTDAQPAAMMAFSSVSSTSQQHLRSNDCNYQRILHLLQEQQHLITFCFVAKHQQ
jgi:hypothetical protein